MTLPPENDDAPTDPPPPLPGESRLRSGCHITRPTTTTPPPNDSHSDYSQPLLTPDNRGEFSVIGRTHQGRSTTSPQNAIPAEVVPPAVTTHNTFDALAPATHDDTSTVGSSDTPRPEATSLLDNIIRATDNTLAAATDDFNELLDQMTPHLDSIEQRLDQRLSANLTTSIGTTADRLQKSFEDNVNSFFTNLKRDVALTTEALECDIVTMDGQIKLMKDSMVQHNKDLTEPITLLSTNTTKLSEETSALSVRVVKHQGHLENLL